MKYLLLPIKSIYMCDILNRQKTYEIRRKIPKCDLPIIVLLYCSNSGQPLIKCDLSDNFSIYHLTHMFAKDTKSLNGKIVGQFTLNNIIRFDTDNSNDIYSVVQICKAACLDLVEMVNYQIGLPYLYALQIDDLEIFDKPKSLSDFIDSNGNAVIKAPQHFMYVFDKTV